jgi:hypothetical protein
MDLGRQAFPTAAGWFFARPVVAHECWVALSCPGRSAAPQGRSRPSSTGYGRAGPRLWLHFVTRCTASGTRDSVGRVRSLIHFSNSPSRSRGAFLRPGFATLLHSPRTRGGRSAEKRSGACEAPVGRIMCVKDARERAYDAIRQALARRLASRNAGRSPLGAPPWRFFTRGRASVTGIIFRIRAASSSQPGRSAWRAASRASRGERLRAAAAGRHASLRLQDRL